MPDAIALYVYSKLSQNRKSVIIQKSECKNYEKMLEYLHKYSNIKCDKLTEISSQCKKIIC